MHILHLLRHAKSSWKEDVEDRERPHFSVQAQEKAGPFGLALHVIRQPAERVT